MSINSTVLDGDRQPLPINSLERVKLELDVELSVSTGLGYPGASDNYCGRGRLTCTNYRLVFVNGLGASRFDTFMVTWNKIEEGVVDPPSIWNFWRGSSAYASTVHPLEDEDALNGDARLNVQCGSREDALKLMDLVRASRWTGHLDPENTAEPPPMYPLSPPPKYEEAITQTAAPERDNVPHPNCPIQAGHSP